MQLVLQFATARCVDGIQILVALQTAALDSFARRHGTSLEKSLGNGFAAAMLAIGWPWNADTGRRGETTTGIHAWHCRVEALTRCR